MLNTKTYSIYIFFFDIKFRIIYDILLKIQGMVGGYEWHVQIRKLLFFLLVLKFNVSIVTKNSLFVELKIFVDVH